MPVATRTQPLFQGRSPSGDLGNHGPKDFQDQSPDTGLSPRICGRGLIAESWRRADLAQPATLKR